MHLAVSNVGRKDMALEFSMAIEFRNSEKCSQPRLALKEALIPDQSCLPAVSFSSGAHLARPSM